MQNVLAVPVDVGRERDGRVRVVSLVGVVRAGTAARRIRGSAFMIEGTASEAISCTQLRVASHDASGYGLWPMVRRKAVFGRYAVL
eukprot:5249947-Prymnesium_polylepis.1